MKFRLFLFFLFCAELSVSAQAPAGLHAEWTGMLTEFVDREGQVDYRGFLEDRARLDRYLGKLAVTPPGKGWKDPDRMAYYINLYNAATIRLILDHYPVRSIREIAGPENQGPWKIDFVIVGNEKVSLDHIEHEILRKEFNEPRIHFALVCAAWSCPPLRREAYTGDELDGQLNESAIKFLGDKARNRINAEKLDISMIFQWFETDFTQNSDLPAYLSKLSGIEIKGNAEIDFIEYDWRLNEKQ